MVASAIYYLGIHINGRWRWSPGLRALGCIGQIAILGALVFSAIPAGDGDIMVLFGTTLSAAHIWFLLLNLGDLWRAVRDWGGYEF